MARKVLFLCTGNAARSQMAEALLRKHGGGDYEAFSAGLDPQPIHPYTIRVMDEIGLDIRQQYSKNIKDYMGRVQFDDAVIVCRRFDENCPTTYADARYIHRWLFDDPVQATGTEEEKLDAFRAVRDRMEARITLWLAEVAESMRPA
ncbi:MAG: arsenate reductase ArsC [Anaerolineae bacterium]|nr:arsenate reductase ArsC [Anaerolineae bacterium]